MQKEKTQLCVLGLGSRSTLFYIEKLNEQYNAYVGSFSTCPFILLNTNFDTINSYLPNDFDHLESQLEFYLEKIKGLKISDLIIPNITLHETWDRLDENVEITHPVYKTIKLLKKKRVNKIVLFGSKYSMESSYLVSYFNSNQIEVVQPEEDKIYFLDELRKLIYNNKETSQELELYHNLLEFYSKNTPVVVACTELSILTRRSENIYDMAMIQIESAVQKLI